MQNFANYFAEFTNGAIALRLLLAAVLGCVIGLERATKHHPAGMRTFALVCKYLSLDSPGLRKDRYVTYHSRSGQRYWIPGGGNHHYYREKSGQRIDNGCRIVDNGNPWNYVGIRNAVDQSDDVCTDHCHNVRNCQSQSCAGAVQSLHWSVYGN